MTDSRPQRRSVKRWFAALSLGFVLAGSGLAAPMSALADDTTTAEPTTAESSTAAPATDPAATAEFAPAVPNVAAAAQNSFAIQPSNENGPDGRTRFDYSLAPGESKTDYVAVSNSGAAPITMRVYPMDASTTVDGSFSIPPASVAPLEVGTWVGLNPAEGADGTATGGGVYTIQPNQEIRIPFKITVPADAIPGDHAGGILASLNVPTSAEQADGSQVAVDSRVGVRVYVSVPGERNPAMTVSKPQVKYSGGWNPVSGKAHVQYSVTNSGNVRVSGTAALSVSGIWGIGQQDATPREINDLLPGATIVFDEDFTGVPPAVKLNAKAEITPKAVEGTNDDPAPQVSSESSVWAFPWIIAAVILVIVLLIVFLIIRGRRTKKKLRALIAASSANGAGSPPVVIDKQVGFENSESAPPATDSDPDSK